MAKAMKNFIVLDSDSENEESPPKRRSSNRVNRRRGRQNAQPLSKRPSSKRLRKIAFVADNDDCFILQEDSFSSRLPLSSEVLSSPVIAMSSADNSTDSLRTTETDDALLAENSIPAVTQPRKTAKRGLAKKQSEPQSDSTTLPSHKVSVYSQAIADGFKSLIHGVDLTGAEAVDDVKKPVASGVKDTGTELSNLSMDISLTETLGVSSKRDQTDLLQDDELLPPSITSPSPPPKAYAKHARKMNKKLKSALKALNKAKIALDKKTPPSKRYQRRDSDVIIVGEETCLKDVIVKVRYLTKVHRLQMKLNEPFHTLINKLSKEIDEAEHNLGLFLHDRSLEVSETPQSVNLSVADIIECHCIKVNEEDSVCPTDAIELVIQCRNNRSKITLTANKRRPLSDVMQKYAQLMNDQVSSFVFSFDGEDIEPADTPGKLDMEDQDVIDVVYN